MQLQKTINKNASNVEMSRKISEQLPENRWVNASEGIVLEQAAYFSIKSINPANSLSYLAQKNRLGDKKP